MFFLFSCWFDKKFTSAVFASYYLKLSLPVFLKCFLIFCIISVSRFLEKDNMYAARMRGQRITIILHTELKRTIESFCYFSFPVEDNFMVRFPSMS